MEKPGAFDYILLAVLIVGPLFEWLVFWPRRVRAIRAGTPGARARTYLTMAAAEWLVTLYVFGLWVMRRRSWNALWLGFSGHLRLDLGFLLAAIIIGLLWLQTRKILAKPKAIMHVREKMAFADPLVPETRAERRGFWLLSFTAGICEEVVFPRISDVVYRSVDWPDCCGNYQLDPLWLGAYLSRFRASSADGARRSRACNYCCRFRFAMAGDCHSCRLGSELRRARISCPASVCYNL